MCDVSDGLIADFGHIARASGVGVDIDSSALSIAEPIRAVAAAYGVDPLDWVLEGGHDHALAATFPVDAVLPEGFVVVGRVTSSEGVRVDGSSREGPGGHEHF